MRGRCQTQLRANGETNEKRNMIVLGFERRLADFAAKERPKQARYWKGAGCLRRTLGKRPEP